MQRVVLTGGPGAGKTTVLDELRNRGYTTGDDAARSIIRERKHANLPPRPDPLTFAKQVFEREIEAYKSAHTSPSFFERGIIDVVGSLFGAGELSEDEVKRLLEDYSYQLIFIFPPWEEIYRTDAERDHTFDHAEKVYDDTLRLYRWCKYEPIVVPLDTVSNRANFILDHVRDA